MFKAHLSKWRKNMNNQLPNKVYMFRDGVSEGQYSQVVL